MRENDSRDNLTEKYIDGLDSVEKNEIPKRLRKSFVWSIILLIFGIGCITFGIYRLIYADLFSAVVLIILSIMTVVPAVYTLFKFCKAKIEKDVDLRREILNEIIVV